MNTATAILLAATLLAAAGCVGTAPRQGTTSPTSSATGSGPAHAANASPLPAPVWAAANWTGFIKAGAAYEAPSHVDETNAATAALWSPSFHYAVQQAPQSMEVHLDWTATAAQIQFMVLLPGNGTETMVETDFADHGPLCAKLPADHLMPGTYSIMAHSKVAIDAQLKFSVTTLGGQGHIIDKPHTAPASEFPAALPGLVSGDGGSIPPEPCTT